MGEALVVIAFVVVFYLGAIAALGFDDEGEP